MKRKTKELSDEEIQESLAAQAAEQVRRQENHDAIEARDKRNSFLEWLNEFIKDFIDKSEQEARGNRVTHSSMIWQDLWPLPFFLLAFIGLFTFVKFCIVPIYGW
jgi:hypothetical protein